MGGSFSCYEGAPVPPHQFVSDTTGHNFAWEVDVLGDGNGSYLNDVAIINDTLAYAVGEFNVRDSSGAWKLPPYNVARWNGASWEPSTTSDSGYDYGPLRCVLAFAPDDIWAGSSTPEQWDGRRWTFHGGSRGFVARAGVSIRKMWGTSSRDLYAVGDGGHIWHYNGTAWKELPSGTTLDFRDIYGAWNIQSMTWDILAVASRYPVNSDRKIVAISGESVTPLLDYPIQYSLEGIWFVPNRFHVTVGGGVYEKKTLDEPLWRNGMLDITPYHAHAARGLDVNDLFVVGDAGEILHYNGMTWQSSRTHIPYAASYNAVAVRGDAVLAVGTNGVRGVVTRGRRVH